MRMTTLHVILTPEHRANAVNALGLTGQAAQEFLGPVFVAPDDYSVSDGVLFVKPATSDGSIVEYIYPLHTVSRVKAITK